MIMMILKMMLRMVTPHLFVKFINRQVDYANYDSIQILCYRYIVY